MTSPQLENGYLKIANELWDALIKIRIPGEQRQCLDLIIRKTYGYNKKADKISVSQFSQATGINRRSVQRALKLLLSRKIIHGVKSADREVVTYGINKNYLQWKHGVKSADSVKSADRTVRENAARDGVKSADYKRQYKDKKQFSPQRGFEEVDQRTVRRTCKKPSDMIISGNCPACKKLGEKLGL